MSNNITEDLSQTFNSTNYLRSEWNLTEWNLTEWNLTDEWNLTNTANINSTEDAENDANIGIKLVKGIIMALMIVATVLGNVIVITAVCKFRNLRTMNNYFILSLAVADLLVGLMVQPFNMYNEMVQGSWKFGHWMCNLYNSNDVFFSTASLLHLCCISCDRYIAILHPFVYERAITKCRVMLMIAMSWILSALLSYLPIFAGLYADDDHLAELRDNQFCKFEVSRTYAFVSSSISFWIPSTIMVVLYQRILSTALRQEKEIRALMRPPPAISMDGSEEPMINGNGSVKGCNGKVASTESWSEDALTPDSLEDVDLNDNLGIHDRGNKKETMILTHKKSKNFTEKKDLKQMKKMRKEHRAAKTLGIIMGCFLACMSPIFLWYTITFGICPETCNIAENFPQSQWVITVVFWIGYFNSCMNPIIYAFFNREFKIAFKRLFKSCRKGNDRDAWRRQSMSS